MYRNTKGFSLPETLVAFNCVLMICGLFIPFLIQYAAGLKQLQREVEALKFLREGVEEAIVTHEFVDHSRTYKGVKYEIVWESGGSGEACVRYDEKAGAFQEVCVGADG